MNILVTHLRTLYIIDSEVYSIYILNHQYDNMIIGMYVDKYIGCINIFFVKTLNLTMKVNNES